MLSSEVSTRVVVWEAQGEEGIILYTYFGWRTMIIAAIWMW